MFGESFEIKPEKNPVSFTQKITSSIPVGIRKAKIVKA
jgi:hypothetical protein